MLIGLTGLSCAGKNYAAGLLAARGLSVLDVDALGHAALDAARERIAERWGAESLLPVGVNRGFLARRVFTRPAELRALEEIVHPIVNQKMEERIRAEGGAPLVINAALLHKCAVFKRLDAVIIVEAPAPVRLLRAKKRDGLPLFTILRRFAHQRGFYARYAAAPAAIFRVSNGALVSSPRSLARLNKNLDIILSTLHPPARPLDIL